MGNLTTMIRLCGANDIVKVESKLAFKIAKEEWIKNENGYISKSGISLLCLCANTKFPEYISQIVKNNDYTLSNLTVTLGDIERDEDLGGYWSCGMLYDDIDSAIYVYKAYLNKKSQKNKQTLLDYIENDQNKNSEREVYIKGE